MIFFLIFLVALAFVLQRKMAPWALNRVSCSVRAEQYLVEPDEPFTLVLTVKNRSRLPIPFLSCSCSAPVDAQLVSEGHGTLTSLIHTAEYRFSCFLMPHQTLEHRFSVKIGRRGGYRFSDLRIYAGDFFGKDERESSFPGGCDVVILPPKPAGNAAQQMDGGLMGERSVLRWIHEDPILSAGFREYTGREPQKTIAWNRSLQSGRLMVRQMDHTAEEKVTVLFSLDKGKWEDLENCFSVCRGICEALEQQKLPYAFLHNGLLLTGVGVLPPVENGLGLSHLDRILEGLGRAQPESRESLTTLIRRTLLRSRDSSCYLLLVPEITPAVRQAAAHLENCSGSVVKLLSGGVAK